MRTVVAALAILFMASGVFAAPAEVGGFGATYPIDEPDLLDELRKRARETDWDRLFGKERLEERVKTFRPEGTAKLPKAEKAQVRHVRYIHTLEFDVPDNYGNVLYPKGYGFNPITYLHAWLPKMAVIDASDESQVKWFENGPMAGDPKVKLLITGGSYYDLSKRLKRPVFYLSDLVAEKLDVRAVPCVVDIRCLDCPGAAMSASRAAATESGDWVLEITEIAFIGIGQAK